MEKKHMEDLLGSIFKFFFFTYDKNSFRVL